MRFSVALPIALLAGSAYADGVQPTPAVERRLQARQGESFFIHRYRIALSKTCRTVVDWKCKAQADMTGVVGSVIGQSQSTTPTSCLPAIPFAGPQITTVSSRILLTSSHQRWCIRHWRHHLGWRCRYQRCRFRRRRRSFRRC